VPLRRKKAVAKPRKDAKAPKPAEDQLPTEAAEEFGEDIVLSPVGPRPRKVGPYRVLKAIGRGGMATVYRGIHESLQREVAIKELQGPVQDKESASRFRREAMALAGFRHQNIVTLYDLIDKEDVPYMILELVNGVTLTELIKEGPLPSEVSAVITAKIASALEHAHREHITHRDIKPSNVMIGFDGEVKLMDFGIAKDEDLASLTRKGLAIGTPAYMSPEQVSAGNLDHRTDLYSLGVLLYECLCGKRPFHGRDVPELFLKIRAGKFTTLKQHNDAVPFALATVVKRAMRTKPEERFVDAAQMRRELELFLGKRVSVSHSALLCAYLYQKGKISKSVVESRITDRELRALDAMHSARSRTFKWSILTAIFFGAGAAIAALTVDGWLNWIRNLFH
jgi:serine/threonine protein kinase